MQTIYRPSTLMFWRYYAVHMRPYLLFVSGIAGAAGIAMGKERNWELWHAITAFTLFFLGYGFGQALTDCFQTDTDKLSAPYRPLSKGIIAVKDVLTVSIAGLLLSGILLCLLRPFSCLLSVIAVFGLATYSYVKKNAWAGGPFYNAWIVALLPLMGYFVVTISAGISFPVELHSRVGISFFAYSSFVLMGYLKDIDADRSTGYKTFPVIWGWRNTTLAGDFLLVVTLLLYWYNAQWGIAGIAAIAASGIGVYGQYMAHTTRQQNEQGAIIPILSTVRSFILFHIAIVLQFQPSWWPLAVIYYLVFEWALYKRPSRFQV